MYSRYISSYIWHFKIYVHVLENDTIDYVSKFETCTLRITPFVMACSYDVRSIRWFSFLYNYIDLSLREKEFNKLS